MSQFSRVVLHAVPLAVLQGLGIRRNRNVRASDNAQNPATKVAHVLGLQLVQGFARFELQSVYDAKAVQKDFQSEGVHLQQRVT
mmetsp:Transcript_7390/g.15301  ORF Transcript_7390/g.15301 Transcript_7390/m.15301 type:complete len:84 (-) Transcript_7390:781-1032(-)